MITNIAVDSNENVYIVALAAHTAIVQEFDNQGHFLREFGSRVGT